jgi:chromosome segregation ATPase
VAGALQPAAAEASPLGKVYELLDSLSAKVTKEGESADKAYREYVEWCDDAASEKRHEIKSSTSKKQKLESSIDKLTAEITLCASKIDKLAESAASAGKDLEAATAIRKKEAADFESNEAELMDTVDTLKRAISIVTKEAEKNPASFAQVDISNFKAVMQSLSAVVDAASLSAANKDKLMALVQSSQQAQDAGDDELSGAPAAAVYKSHSAGLVDLMEDLQEKAEEDLGALRKAEANEKQNYLMLKQSLETSMSNGGKDLDDEKMAKSAAEEEKAMNEKDLGIVLKALEGAESMLAEIKSECMSVAADHEASVASRAEELKVIAEAKGVLQESNSAALDQISPSFVQVGSGMRSRADLKRAEVLSVVKRLAKRFHSSTMTQLASRIAAVIKLKGASGEDPFAKIKGMIQDMIAKLEQEAASAADEKAYCDDEMSKTAEKKDELEDDIEKLTAKMDKADATSVMLKNEVKQLQMELASLAKSQAEMDKIRNDQRVEYTKAKADLDEALAGLRKALEILRQYYGSKEAAAMLQSGSDLGDFMAQPAKPVMHSKSTGAGQGIIGILEVCASDSAKNLARIEQEEDDEQSYYDEMTQANKKTKALKVQDVTYKVQEFKSLDKSLADMSSDKETTDAQLKAVLEYFAKVKDRCVAKPEGYEERKRRRDAEVAGLKEALSILESETALVQVRSRRATRQAFLRQ